jgi:hypothetical protein
MASPKSSKSNNSKDKDSPSLGDMLGKFASSELVQNAVGVKDEVVSLLRQEVQKRLPSIDWHEILDEIVKKYDFEIKATISLKEKNKK